MQQSPLTRSELYGRLVVRRVFPILGTCGLIYWLEGGIPPASLTQFIQVCTHLNTLWASNESNTLISLVLLIAQILCVLFAWGCLLWLMIREFQTLLAGNVSQRKINGEHARQASATLPIFQVGEQAQASFLPPTIPTSWPNAQPAVFPQYTSGQPQNAPQHYPDAATSGNHLASLENPFGNPIELHEESLRPSAQPQRIAGSRDSGALEPYNPNMHAHASFIPTHPQTQKEMHENPFDVKQDVLNTFESGEPGTRANDLAANRALQKPSTTTNTFTSFAAGSNITVSGSPSLSGEDEEEEDDPFTFGDPFAGPLPDVFHHDHDLRKEIMEQTGAIIDLPIEQTRPREKRLKKKTPPQEPPQA